MATILKAMQLIFALSLWHGVSYTLSHEDVALVRLPTVVAELDMFREGMSEDSTDTIDMFKTCFALTMSAEERNLHLAGWSESWFNVSPSSIARLCSYTDIQLSLSGSSGEHQVGLPNSTKSGNSHQADALPKGNLMAI